MSTANPPKSQSGKLHNSVILLLRDNHSFTLHYIVFVANSTIQPMNSITDPKSSQKGVK